MKLIVFKYLSHWRQYRDCLVEGTNRNLFTCKKVGVLSTNSENPSFNHLRGHQFDEVLWVGYEDGQDVDFTAPYELLAQTYGAKYHYCKPAEPQKTFTSVKVNKEDVTVSLDELWQNMKR